MSKLNDLLKGIRDEFRSGALSAEAFDVSTKYALEGYFAGQDSVNELIAKGCVTGSLKSRDAAAIRKVEWACDSIEALLKEKVCHADYDSAVAILDLLYEVRGALEI